MGDKEKDSPSPHTQYDEMPAVSSFFNKIQINSRKILSTPYNPGHFTSLQISPHLKFYQKKAYGAKL